MRRTQGDVYGLALRLCRDPDDAADITQETFIRAVRALDGFRGDASFTTWLYRITANTASTHMSRRFRRRTDPFPVGFEAIDESPEADPQTMAAGEDFRRRLDRAIAALPPKLRAVVVLRDVYDLPHDAIAEELGITVSAAKVRLHRARQALRAEVFD